MEEQALNKVVAQEVAHCEQLRAKAEAVKATAAGLATIHNKTGEYISSLKVVYLNKVDYAVVATDKAAAHIEFGHKVDLSPKPGKRTNRENNKPDFNGGSELRRGERWVQGLHIMRNAALAHGGKVG